MAERYREREDKFDVDPGWAVPDLTAALPTDARIERDTVSVTSTYYDTAELDLLSRGVTLRRRSGDVDAGWQLKLPDGAARTELRLPSNGRAVPKELRDLVLGLRAGRPLQPVATLDTERGRSRVLDRDGAVLAEVADDMVHATTLGSTATVSQWREMEIELGSGSEKLLGQLSKFLRRAGATPSREASKLARAMSRPSVNGRAASPVGRSSTVGDVVGRYLRDQHQALLDGDLALRRGEDVIHRTRVATRRYRSVLRCAAELFDPSRAAALDTELAWYAGLLGAVRDPQVQRAHFDQRVRSLPAEIVLGPVAGHIDQQLLRTELAAREQLARAMRGRRYLALLAELDAWHAEPPLTTAADRPAADVADFLNATERKLAKRLKNATRSAATDETLHQARKAGKRTRYVAELAEPVVGKHAHRVVERATAVQDVLGEHQDSIVAGELLRRLGANTGTSVSENGFTYGILYAQEDQRAHAARKRVRALSWRR